MPEYQCLWFQFYRASNFYCMAIATELLMPTGPPSAADWVAAYIAAASEMSVTAAAAIAAAADNSFITAAADAAAVNAPNAAVAAPLAAGAGNNDDDAITTPKLVSVISSAAKITLDKRRHDNQPDERDKRGYWQRKQQQL
jgi:hypothetical protein